MKRVILSCENIQDRAHIGEVLKETLGFPEYCGNSLDSIHDCLTDIAEETEIVILMDEELRETLGSYLQKTLTMLSDTVIENKNVSFVIKAYEYT